MSPHKPGSDFHFTEKALAALAVPEKGRDFYRDAETEGLTLVVRASGAKSFAWYKKVNGRPWWERLGVDDFPAYSIEAARAAASELNKKLNRWKDDGYPEPCPFTRKEKPEPPAKELTLRALLEAYIERRLKGRAKNPDRAVKDAENAFKLHCATWMDRPCSRITTEDVAKLHDSLGRKAKYAANRQVERIRAVYNFGIKAKLYRGENPAAGMEKFEERPRTRYLLDEELPQFKKALDAAPSRDFRHYIWLSFLTAARKGDVLSMRWTDVDLERKVWTVPDPKSGHPYSINLVPQVVDILEERRKSQRRKSRRKTLVESNFVFPGTGKTGHVTDYKKQWRSLLRAAKLDYPNGERLRPTLHDLRRSFGTHMLNNGFPLEVVSKMLGHANIAITSRAYAHVSNERVAEAAEKTAAALAGMRPRKLLPAPAFRGRLAPAKR